MTVIAFATAFTSSWTFVDLTVDLSCFHTAQRMHTSYMYCCHEIEQI